MPPRSFVGPRSHDSIKPAGGLVSAGLAKWSESRFAGGLKANGEGGDQTGGVIESYTDKVFHLHSFTSDLLPLVIMMCSWKSPLEFQIKR